MDRTPLHADAELDIDPISLAEAHHIAHGAEHEVTHEIPKLGSAMTTPIRHTDSVGSSLQEH